MNIACYHATIECNNKNLAHIFEDNKFRVERTWHLFSKSEYMLNTGTRLYADVLVLRAHCTNNSIYYFNIFYGNIYETSDWIKNKL